MPDKSQQTEQPTQRRLDKARKEGNYPSARQFVSGIQFLTFVAVAASWGGVWFKSTGENMTSLLSQAFRSDLGGSTLVGIFSGALLRSSLPLAGAAAMLLLATLAAQFAVTRLGVSLAKLKPDFKRLSPLSKLRELPRQNIPAFAQAMVLLPLFGAAVYYLVHDHLDEYLTIPLRSPGAGVRYLAVSVQALLWKASAAFLVFGFVDLFRQRRRYIQDLKMTKQEIKDEFKELEGNPQMKARIRRLRRERLRRRMMSEVPKATAVIVNPTHYAVAIRYELNSMAAPVVVAKGKNYLALRIRQRATGASDPAGREPSSGPGTVQVRRGRAGDTRAPLPGRGGGSGLHIPSHERPAAAAEGRGLTKWK